MGIVGYIADQGTIDRPAASNGPGAAPLLSVAGHTRSFWRNGAWHPVVRDVSFGVGPHETVAIVGESGSGKSVTALSIMRLVRQPNGRIAGSIKLAGRELLTLPELQMQHVRGNEISMIFQEPMTSLNPVLTIGFQIAEALRCHRAMSRSADQYQLAHSAIAVTRDISRGLSAARGVADVNGVAKIEMLDNCHDIRRAMVHVMAIARLARAAMTPAIVSDDTIAVAEQVENLGIPLIGAQWPAVVKDDRLSALGTPVLVENLKAIFGCDARHGIVLWAKCAEVRVVAPTGSSLATCEKCARCLTCGIVQGGESGSPNSRPTCTSEQVRRDDRASKMCRGRAAMTTPGRPVQRSRYGIADTVFRILFNCRPPGGGAEDVQMARVLPVKSALHALHWEAAW